MKNKFRLAVLCLAVSSISAMARNAVPGCGSANCDQSRNVFTAVNPSADSVNQPCMLRMFPKGTVSDQSRQSPAFYPTEGRSVIELSGGSGGRGGIRTADSGGRGGHGFIRLTMSE